MKFLQAFLIFALLVCEIGCKKKEESSPDNKTSDTASTSNTGCGIGSTVSDIDGNVYNIIQIGNQCWLKENLRTAHYQNGDPILTNVSDVNWKVKNGPGAYAVYGNEGVYGKLYNWSAVKDSRQICPSGFHIPSSMEWDSLIIFLGGINQTATKLKSTTLWSISSASSTYNSTGFTAVPSGCREYDGSYSGLGDYAYFWSSNDFVTNPSSILDAYNFQITSNDFVLNEHNLKQYGFSCRCLYGPPNVQLHVGQSYLGGKIAYLDATGIHGLIAATVDQSDSIYWHSSNSGNTHASGVNIGTGNANTNSIVTLYGAEINAASLCSDLVLGGYSDWYLPSVSELWKLSDNRTLIGGFSNVKYWSSSETGNQTAQAFNFSSNSAESYSNKINKFAVRAVRTF